MFTVKIGTMDNGAKRTWRYFCANDFKFIESSNGKLESFIIEPIVVKENSAVQQKALELDLPNGDYELYVENLMGKTSYAYRTPKFYSDKKKA